MQKIITLISVFTILTFSLKSQTSGPTQPDFMKFSQIETGKNVNEFDGSFNYSIPVLSIPSGNKVGYSLQLTYQSGLGPNDEATWVGFGWSLNPGSIVRQVKGFPDDFDGVTAKIINKVKPTISVSDITTINGEILSLDDENFIGPQLYADKSKEFGGGISLTRVFSNSTGYSYTTNVGIHSELLGGVNYNADNLGNKSFDVTISPSIVSYILGFDKHIDRNNDNTNWQSLINDRYIIASGFYSSLYRPSNWGKGQMPMSMPSYDGTSLMFVPKFNLEFGLVGVETSLPFATFIETCNKYTAQNDVKIYGMMYSGKGFIESNNFNNKVLMDYYNEKESGLSMRNKNLPIPFANTDNFVVSGNGLGGSFKLQSKKIGLFRPQNVTNTSEIYDVASTIGINIPEVTSLVAGLDARYGWTKNTLGGWSGGNRLSFNNESGVINYYGVDEYSSNILYSYNPNQEYSKKYNNLRNYEGRDFSENYFFKFTNDLTYRQNYNGCPEWDKYPSNIKDIFSPLKTYIVDNKLVIGSNNSLQTVLNNNNRVSRSSYIDYTLFNNTIQNGTQTENEFEINCNNLTNKIDYQQIGNVQSSDISGKLKEFKIVNKDGATYCYAQPVMNSNEESANIFIEKLKYSNTQPSIAGEAYTKDGTLILNSTYNINSILSNNSNDNIYCTGRIINDSYSSAFLITKILSPDYIDLTMDGPSIDDVGDYVLFNYRKKQTNYKWRDPYIGLKYSKNSLSDVQDDIGSYSLGEKEIYYLESIETKTHIAIFVTNKFDLLQAKLSYKKKYIGSTGSNNLAEELDLSDLKGSQFERLDAFQAIGFRTNATLGRDQDLSYHFANNSNILERLEKIVLYSKDLSRTNEIENNKKVVFLSNKLQTTNLSYDETYPIWAGMVNTKTSTTNQYKKGKLTLNEVWFDKENTKEGNVSKYKFSYLYPRGTGNSLIDNFLIGINETPSYNINNINRWNQYEEKFYNSAFNPSMYLNNEISFGIHKVDQKNKATYDPAAYNLKHIILPNGAENIIQYEQKDYSFVQNRNATVLFKLNTITSQTNNHTIRLKPDATIELDNTLLSVYKEFLVKTIKDSLIYFKYYYYMPETGTHSNPFDCAFDYTDGYNRVSDITVIGDEIQITFTENIGLKKCQDFYNKRRNGLVSGNENCEPCKNNGITHKILDTKEEVSGSFDAAKGWYNGSNNYCGYVEPEHSYIKLPLPEFIPKKGGGIRVKRDLTIDNFDMESETESIVSNRNQLKKVYGNEYVYGDNIVVNGINCYKSFGVASNEPQKGGEENALKNYVADIEDEFKDNTSFPAINSVKYSWNENLQEQNEGPYCESVLPGPSVNYSKVITKSINSSIFNDNNIIVKEFNTTKDYPFDMVYNIKNKDQSEKIKGVNWNRISKNNDKNNNYALDLLLPATKLASKYIKNIPVIGKLIPIGISVKEDIQTFSQGYQFIINNMNGTPKRVSSYSANNIDDKKTWKMGTDLIYEYYEPGEAVPIVDNIDKFTVNNFNGLAYDWLGLNTEYSNESRELTNTLNKVNGDIDARIPLVPGAGILKLSGSAGYQNMVEKYRYFTSSKIINLPTILKKQTNYSNGLYTTSENIAFDPLSGDPVIKKSSDVYSDIASTDSKYLNNKYYEYDIKSSLIYKNEKGLYENNKLKFSSILQLEGGYPTFKLFKIASPTTTSSHYIKLEVLDKWAISYNSCEIMKNFHIDEVLKVSNSSLNAGNINDKLFFKIKDVQCNSMSLELISPTEPYSFVDNNILVDIEVIKSKLSNDLTSSVAKIITYGQDSIENTSYPKELLKVNNLTSGNYINNPNWDTPILLQNELNTIINSICSSLPPKIYPPISDYFMKSTFPLTRRNIITSNPIKLKNIDGICQDVPLNEIEVSGDLFDFSPESYNNPVQYRVNGDLYYLYHLVLEIKYFKKNLNLQGFNSIQRFNSYVGIPVSSISIPKIKPSFEFKEKNNLEFNRVQFNNRNDIAYPDSNSNRVDFDKIVNYMGATHFNQSWCTNLAALSFCNEVNFDYVNENKVILKSNVTKMNDVVGTKNRPFLYSYFMKESNRNQNSPFTLLNIPSSIDTDLELSKKACRELVINKLLVTNTKNHVESSHLFDNTPSSTSEDIIEGSPLQTINPQSNNLVPSTLYNSKSGVMSNKFTLFNWSDNSRNDDWIQTQTMLFNSNIAPYAEKDVYGNIKGVTYDNYIGLIPTMSVSKYNPKLALFEDFENYNYLMLHNYNIDNINFYPPSLNSPHTGRNSGTISQNELFLTTSTIEIQELFDNYYQQQSEVPDYHVMIWVKHNNLGSIANLSNLSLKAMMYLVPKDFIWLNPYQQGLSINKLPIGSLVNLQNSLQIGDWYLYEGILPKSAITSMFNNVNTSEISYLSVVKLGITLESNVQLPSNSYLNIDDIRLSPYDADVNCFVTDWESGYKISAVLDNNHMPLLFKYDQKGDLKSKVLVTTKGEKTLNEEFYNIPKTPRDVTYSPIAFPIVESDNKSGSTQSVIQENLNDASKNINPQLNKIKKNNMIVPKNLNENRGVNEKRNYNPKSIFEAFSKKDTLTNDSTKIKKK